MVRQKAESDQGRVLGGGRFAVNEHVCCVAIAVSKWYMGTCDYEVKSGQNCAGRLLFPTGCSSRPAEPAPHPTSAPHLHIWGGGLESTQKLDVTDPDVVEMNESIVIDERTSTGGRRRTTVEGPIAGCCQSPIGGCYLISSVICQS